MSSKNRSDIQAVKTLAVPSKDTKRDFAGLQTLKMDKKDRHMARLQEFSKFLEEANEIIIQEVSTLSRDIREGLEVVDANFEKFYKTLDDYDFLIIRSEEDLYGVLDELKGKINSRSQSVEAFATALSLTETKRADLVGTELKRLVDNLIAIAHQLPDDIEHIVEDESYELNTEIIKNRKSIAVKIGTFRVVQVKLEAAALQKWEDSRAKWRQIRHEKGLNDFKLELDSEAYTDPGDRQHFMKRFRSGQDARRQSFHKEFNSLLTFSSDNIDSEKVAAVQRSMVSINDSEMAAIKSFYRGVTDLRSNTIFHARERVEDLRKELHLYGALKLEPDWKSFSAQLQSAVNDESLVELWRLSGGLKVELQGLVSDVMSTEIIYERLVESVLTRLDTIVCGFGIKVVLKERGRLAQLEKCRGLISKMRTSPRGEVAAVLRALIPEIEDVANLDSIDPLFKSLVIEITSEIAMELSELDSRIASEGVGGGSTRDGLLSSKGGRSVNTASPSASHSGKPKSSGGASVRSSATGKTGGTSRSGKTGTSGGLGKDIDNAPSVDAAIVKAWNRKLGILFYGSDMPEVYQLALVNSQKAGVQQRECNTLVDAAVFKQSDLTLRTLDRNYSTVADAVVTFLEAQSNSLCIISTNVGDYYLQIAKLCEKHRAQQKLLDEKSADEFWDIKENLRFDLEDREAAYEGECQHIRESTQAAVLHEHFEQVLVILNGIQQEYRNYHAKGCFIADKYPLILVDEFASHLRSIGTSCFFTVGVEHKIVSEYERIFNTCVRLNQAMFDESAEAAGVTRVETLPIADIIGEKEDAANESFDSPNVVNNAGVAPENVYAGTYYLLEPIAAIVAKFNVDGSFAAPDPLAIAEAEAEAAAAAAAEQGGTASSRPVSAGPSEAAAKLLRRAPHEGCAFMAADTPVLLPLLTEEELDVLREEDPIKFQDFQNAVVKGFLPLAAEKLDEMTAQKDLHPEVMKQYTLYCFIRDLNANLKQQRRDAAEHAVVLANPPVDCKGSLWVSVIQITDGEVSKVFTSIRNSMCAALEGEAFRRIITAESSTLNRKKEYTDELEERVRNHWPRRGRVETQIKQPREAELLSHKEKTWRHIQSIQEKMIDLQGRFDETTQRGQQNCDNYVNEMTTLRNSLSEEGSFKNLASLQGVDCKARGFTLTFQEEAGSLINVLMVMADQQTEAVVAFARDFRKICPPQQPGVEGGYSDSEISEISALVEGQRDEIVELAEEWRAIAAQLKEQQEQSLKCQDEFTARYDKAVQDLSMAEGLGQRYGAPRRRAQERLRTEVSRDEQSAGKVDELLAKLEFVVSEAEAAVKLAAERQREEQEAAASGGGGGGGGNDHGSVVSSTESMDGLAGRAQLLTTNGAWSLLMQVRLSLQRRAVYLRVMDSAAPDANIGGAVSVAINPVLAAKDSLPWLPLARLKYFVDSGGGTLEHHHHDESGEGEEVRENTLILKPLAVVEDMPPAPRQTLEEVCAEADSSCRAETRALYTAEGKQNMLGAGADGVPASLQAWLEMSKEKMLGRHGHREKAWKRLWAQVARSEGVLSRSLPNDKSEGGNIASAAAAAKDPETTTTTTQGVGDSKDAVLITYKLGVPAVCLLAMAESFILYCKKDRKQRWDSFGRLLRVWELGRAKHERLLRPQLGSPDRADELAELDRLEKGRSAELEENVLKLRSVITRTQTTYLTNFFEDIGTCSKSLLLMLDSTLRQQLLQVPPDTAIPKIHMTLKRLRKAQRIRDEIARGGEDKSQIRTWAAISTKNVEAVIQGAEELVHDLGKEPTDTMGDVPTGGDAVPAGAAATVPEKKAAKGKAAAPVAAVETAGVAPTLVRPAWVRHMAEKTTARTLVSSAHRALIDQRDAITGQFADHYAATVNSVRDEFQLILQQESSWSERWARQVDMLRNGSV